MLSFYISGSPGFVFLNPLSPREQRRPSDRPGAAQGAKRRKRTLDGEDRSEIIRDEGKGIQEREGRAGRGSPRRACADARGDTLLVELGPLLHIHPHWVTASLLISKLQAGARENVLSRALRDLGRLVKTQFILRWIENQDYRRRIHRQLNKGEALHALRRFLFFAHEGKVQRRQADQQTNQILCLNLVTNAIVTWNTVYMNAAIDRLRAEGRIGRDIDLGHLSPALYGHVNPYGKYRFEIEARAPGLRPLRSPGNDV